MGLRQEEAEVAKEESHNQKRALSPDAQRLPQEPHWVLLRLKRRLVRLIREHAPRLKEELAKEFIMPIKTNRKLALSLWRTKSGATTSKSALSN